MKIKTLISSSLAIGFLFNTTLPSIANTLSDDTRYETLEGEYITIDDSIEGELHEIEIFGNTIQDENNLEDIQSAGDLYVDEDGNPILDNQGREQYKITLMTANSEIDYDTSYTILGDGNFISDFIEIPNFLSDKPLYLFTDTNLDIYSAFQVKIEMYNNKKELISSPAPWFSNVNRNGGIILDPKTKYIKIGSAYSQWLDKYNKVGIGTEFQEYNLNTQKDKIEIILPTQLQRVGDVADRLYWDNERSRYIIEKNIHSFITNSDADVISNWANILGTIGLSATGKDLNSVTSDSQGKNDSIYIAGCKNTNWGNNGANLTQDNVYIASYRKDDFKPVRVYKNPNTVITDEETNQYFRNKLCLFRTIPEVIETNITSKLKIPVYEGTTHIYIETENGVSPTLKVTVDRTINRAKEAIETAKTNPTMENISLARMWTNLIKESTIKDSLQEDINEIAEVVDLTIDKKTATANLDLYVKSNNSLTMSLSTNSVTFENYSGVEDLEMLDAVNITINSSLPYSLNAYMPTPISNADGSNTMDANILNIRDNSKNEYSQFINTTNKVVLKDSCEAGNNNIHNIDLKLSGNNLHEADIYKTVIKFEAEQK